MPQAKIHLPCDVSGVQSGSKAPVLGTLVRLHIARIVSIADTIGPTLVLVTDSRDTLRDTGHSELS